MAATISRLRTRPERATDADADQLRALLQRRPDLLDEWLTTKAVARLDQRKPGANGWRFLLVDPETNRLVTRWLTTHSAKPMVAVVLWATMLSAMRFDTGEVAMTRDELAEAVGTSPTEVSRIMTELEDIGAVSRKRQKVAGMRGPGVVRYFVSPRIATHQTGAARDKAQATAPQLRLVPKGV